jgi:hypothetical protein
MVKTIQFIFDVSPGFLIPFCMITAQLAYCNHLGADSGALIRRLDSAPRKCYDSIRILFLGEAFQ